jgi:hypothetical protein
MLWIGDRLSSIEALSMRSFLFFGHPVELYSYTEIEGVPPGVVQLDANRIVDERGVFSVNGSYALFSDYFRFQLLLNQGGIWADSDLVCLKPFDFSDEVVLCGETPGILSIGMLKMPADHSIARAMIARCGSPPAGLLCPGKWEMRIARHIGTRYRTIYKMGIQVMHWRLAERIALFSRLAPWGSIAGPRGFTEVVENSGAAVTVLKSSAMYPVPYRQWRDIFYDTGWEKKIRLSDSYAIHLWNQKFETEEGFSKDGPFQQGTLISDLIGRYASEAPGQ